MKYSCILFDLDGTLIDSKETIRRSFEYALKKLKVPNPQISDINSLIGPPMLTTLQEVFGLTLSEARMGYEYYQEEYVNNGQMYQARLYEGVKETIEILSQRGYFIGVATTKNEVNARKIIKYIEIDIDLLKVYGTYNDGARSGKKQIITDILTDHGIEDLAKVVMVGDRHFDITGAREVGIDSVGVLYGCGSEEELKKAEPTHLISKFAELLTIV
jgi:phosphoglycolate phosphatase